MKQDPSDDEFLDRYPHVGDLEFEKGAAVRDLVERMRGTGFNAGKVYRAARLWLEAARNPEVRVYFTLAGAMVPAGMRRVIAGAIDAGAIDVLSTTGANMVHDGLQGYAKPHRKGTEFADDAELRRRNVLRVYDIFIPWGPFEKYDNWLRDAFFPSLADSHADGSGLVPPRIIFRELGKHLAETFGDDGVLATAYRRGVPVLSPSFTDSNYGIMLDLANRMTLKEKGVLLRVDQTSDFAWLVENMAQAKARAVGIIGGGSPKNYVLQASEALCEDDYHRVLGLTQAPLGFRYAFQVTTDAPHWGGLSGATLSEAISWRKVDPQGQWVTVYSDATIVLPLLAQYVIEGLQGDGGSGD